MSPGLQHQTACSPCICSSPEITCKCPANNCPVRDKSTCVLQQVPPIVAPPPMACLRKFLTTRLLAGPRPQWPGSLLGRQLGQGLRGRPGCTMHGQEGKTGQKVFI